MKIASKNNISATVVMDERYRFLDRFRLNNGNYCFPKKYV